MANTDILQINDRILFFRTLHHTALLFSPIGPHTAHLHRYLDMAFTADSGVRRQDATYVFSSVARNDLGRCLAWDYLRDQWKRISD